MTVTAKVWLVGESNPHGADPRFALYPEPEHSAGGRLCRKVLGLAPRDYLRRFERRNLLAVGRTGAWSTRDAREAAHALAAESAGAPMVLFGRRVWDAFAYVRPEGVAEFARPAPFAFAAGGLWLFLPHPSGRCREWNEPGAYARAAQLVRVLEAW